MLRQQPNTSGYFFLRVSQCVFFVHSIEPTANVELEQEVFWVYKTIRRSEWTPCQFFIISVFGVGQFEQSRFLLFFSSSFLLLFSRCRSCSLTLCCRCCCAVFFLLFIRSKVDRVGCAEFKVLDCTAWAAQTGMGFVIHGSLHTLSRTDHSIKHRQHTSIFLDVSLCFMFGLHRTVRLRLNSHVFTLSHLAVRTSPGGIFS